MQYSDIIYPMTFFNDFLFHFISNSTMIPDKRHLYFPSRIFFVPTVKIFQSSIYGCLLFVDKNSWIPFIPGFLIKADYFHPKIIRYAWVETV
jgi:hypothetical protein